MNQIHKSPATGFIFLIYFNMEQLIFKNTAGEIEWVIYGNQIFFDSLNKALEDEIKRLGLVITKSKNKQKGEENNE